MIEKYEKERFQLHAEGLAPTDVLKHLMEAQGHQPADLWGVLADKGTVSKILSGQRELSKNHIKKLSQLYNVSPALFV